jgi:hypothetical protein
MPSGKLGRVPAGIPIRKANALAGARQWRSEALFIIAIQHASTMFQFQVEIIK